MYITVCISEQYISEAVCNALEEYGAAKNSRDFSLKQFSSTEEMLNVIQQGYAPDGLFIGIKFNNDIAYMDAIDEIRKLNFFVPIFIVSDAVQPIDMVCKSNAKRFLFFPFAQHQFSECIEIVELYIKHRTKYMWQIPSKKKTITLYFESIIYLTTDKHNMIAYMTFGKQVMFRKTIEKCLREIPQNDFLQCHRCYVINMSFVRYIRGNIVIMSNGDEIPIGRAFKRRFINALH